MKFALPDQLPKSVAELDVVRNRAGLEIGVFTARQAAGQEFTEQDVDRLEYLLDSRDKIDVVDAHAGGSPRGGSRCAGRADGRACRYSRGAP